MPRTFWTFLAIGVALAAGLVGFVLFFNRGAHLELKGSIQKVRTLAADENSSIAVADFRFVNGASYPFVVRDVTVSIEDKNGKKIDGAVVSESDARRLFEYYPILGQKFNETLMSRQRIAARQSMDKMVAARFEIPEPQLQARKKLIIRVEDVDGAVSEITQ